MLPSFLIVGAQRSGTTSLWRALRQHPAVVPPAQRKGVHYFDVGYQRGFTWYRGHFPLVSTARWVAARTGSVPITGESSPYYMFHPLAGERIAADLPDVKLLVLLRDPVERAYSAYEHERVRGFETESFERAIELEPERLAGEVERMLADHTYYSHTHRHNGYVARGEYIDQLERLEKLFGRERLQVVDSHEFFENPTDVFAGVLDFLGLGQRADIQFGQTNARERSPMPVEIHDRLEEHFRPYDERLAAWLGRVPRWRR